jgi:hypothetical protein
MYKHILMKGLSVSLCSCTKPQASFCTCIKKADKQHSLMDMPPRGKLVSLLGHFQESPGLSLLIEVSYFLPCSRWSYEKYLCNGINHARPYHLPKVSHSSPDLDQLQVCNVCKLRVFSEFFKSQPKKAQCLNLSKLLSWLHQCSIKTLECLSHSSFHYVKNYHNYRLITTSSLSNNELRSIHCLRPKTLIQIA